MSGVLKGRKIVVTGAGGGLGAEYARVVAAEGATVVVNDLEAHGAEAVAEEIRSAGGLAVAHACDVSDWDAAHTLINRCTQEFGGVDGLVNNAGIIGQVGSVLDTEPERLRAVLRVNVEGTVYPSVHAARLMTKNGGGAIVNVSSGNQCGHVDFASYGASKGGATSLTYGWAAELGPLGVRVNAISPNARTGMTADLENQLGSNPEERAYPSEHDNAVVVAYLLSDLAEHLHGQVLRVDRGMVSVMSHPAVVEPRVPVEYSIKSVGEAFEGQLRGELQPLGLSLASLTHLEMLY